MKRKKLKINVCGEDVRGITSSVVGLILQRLGRKYSLNANELNKELTEGSGVSILEAAEKLIQDMEESLSELSEIGDLASQVSEIEKMPVEEAKKKVSSPE
jgi:EAL domain-containing protein (putative c-di-GMP-specific phosphodiesterase class I)